MWTIILYSVYVLVAIGVIVYVMGKPMYEKECKEADRQRAANKEARAWHDKLGGS